MQFKVGQRVRIVAVHPTSRFQRLVGAEGVVDALNCENNRGWKNQVGVIVDGLDLCFPPEYLQPLTNPGQQSIVEEIYNRPSESLTDFSPKPRVVA